MCVKDDDDDEEVFRDTAQLLSPGRPYNVPVYIINTVSRDAAALNTGLSATDRDSHGHD